MKQEEAALIVAEESIKRWGFVVCRYRSDRLPDIGSKTKVLWKEYLMPQSFVVLRKATEEEWRLHTELCKLFMDLKDPRNKTKPGIAAIPFVLVTD